MTGRDNAILELTPEVLLKAYACGIFPMAENADDPALFWIDPDEARRHPARRISYSVAPCAHGARHAATASCATAISPP